MEHALSILLAQINPTVGAVHANTEKMLAIIENNQHNHDVIVFPELAITGYPPEDLLLRHELYAQVKHALITLKEATKNCHVIVGHPSIEEHKRYNSASLLHNGKEKNQYHKQHIPTYGVFDENRYFTQGKAIPCVFEVKGHKFGLCICEDLWQPGPVENLVAAGIQTLICINASPFEIDKYNQRISLLKQHAKNQLNILYVNQVGGQDELVFDGQSIAMDKKGNICARLSAFSESIETITIKKNSIQGTLVPLLEQEALIYQALVCGLSDYVIKNRFPGVLLGLSGGIDSALTLAIAVDAVGAENVHAVLMPSRYTASISLEDALSQLKNLSVNYSNLSIEPTFNALLETLSPEFKELKADTTEENLQARIRGVLLMALSNKKGSLLLTTSNKSETAVGYATLYGDMAGGFSVLKDVLKTDVYALAHFRNASEEIIPTRVLTRAPSAELAENQTDQDSLPDYATLDAIIRGYMEQNLSINELVSQGFDKAIVTKIIQLITRNEYKRRQSAPGVKISSRAFGRDWRYPITSAFKHAIEPKKQRCKINRKVKCNQIDLF